MWMTGRRQNQESDFPKAPYYRDFREMLAKEKNNIDAVSISTPDHTHAIATLSAMQLGKHVYTQKPLTHIFMKQEYLAQAELKYKVVTQMGNQGGSGDGVRKAKEMIDAGMIGKVTEAHAWTNRPVWPQGIATPTGKHDIPKELDWDLWQGPAKAIDYNPAYLPFNWRGWWAYGTGALGDMACHIMDPIYRILPIDYPDAAECSVATVWKEMWNDTQNLDACPPSSIIHLNYPEEKMGKEVLKFPGMMEDCCRNDPMNYYLKKNLVIGMVVFYLLVQKENYYWIAMVPTQDYYQQN